MKLLNYLFVCLDQKLEKQRERKYLVKLSFNPRKVYNAKLSTIFTFIYRTSMTLQRKYCQVAKLSFSDSSVSLEAVNKRERDKLYKVILRAKITAKRVFHQFSENISNVMNVNLRGFLNCFICSRNAVRFFLIYACLYSCVTYHWLYPGQPSL